MEVEISEQDVFIPLLWTDWVYLDLCSWSRKSILPKVDKFKGKCMAITAEKTERLFHIPDSWYMEVYLTVFLRVPLEMLEYPGAEQAWLL